MKTGFFVLVFVIIAFEMLHFYPSFAHSNYIHMTSIGFLLVLLTTISFSDMIYNLEGTNMNTFYTYFIPIIPVFIPILGFTFIQYSIKKHKKNYGLEDDALFEGRSEKSKYIGLNILYLVMTMIYIYYLYQVLISNPKSRLEYSEIMTISIGLFILLEIIIYFMWDYYHNLLKQKADG